MRVLGLRSERGRRRRRQRAYTGMLEAAIGLIDESAGPQCPLGRGGRIELTAALLRVAAADRTLRAALDRPYSSRRLEDAVHELDEVRGVLEEVALIGVGGAPSRSARTTVRTGSLICSRCEGGSPPDARGWRAYLLADDAVGICCPACADRS